MGTQDRPASSVRSGPFSHYVFLLVVVDRRDETWLCLLGRGVERPKTEAVRLGTAGKHDALKRHIARGESVERIFQYSGIWLNSFSHRGFLDIGSEDKIGHLIKRRKGLCRPFAVQEIDADVRGSGLSPIARSGSARGCGDPPLWVLCDGVNDSCTKDTIGSHNQDLVFRGPCFRSSQQDKASFQIVSTMPRTDSDRNLRKTGNQVQVVHGQGAASLLKIVVVLVHNPGPSPSPHGVPLQSAPSGSDACEV